LIKKVFFTKRTIFTLAPMDGFTDCAFRELVKEYSNCDLLFTEFVNCEGLIKATNKLLNRLRYTEFQRPIIAQLFGYELDYFYKASVFLCLLGFDGIDINMGCPSRNIESRGGGARLIKNRQLAIEIIKTVKKAVKNYKSNNYKIDNNLINIAETQIKEWNIKVNKKRRITVSVKTRIGYEKDITEDWIKYLAKSKPDFISIHARTFKQGYKGKADWNAIKRAVKSTDVPIIANGDIISPKDIQKIVKQTKCQGVMIGRGALGKPWILNRKQKKIYDYKFVKKIILEHAHLYLKFRRGDKFYELRKHFSKYIKCFRNARKLRSKIVRVDNMSQLIKILGTNSII